MNKLITLSLVLNLSFCLNAQITIRNENIVEKPVLKPSFFDSLTNLAFQTRPIDYKKYIGYKLFFVPRSAKTDQVYPDTIINFLFTEKNTQIILDGKIPFAQLSRNTRYYGDDPTKLTGEMLTKFNQGKEKYDLTVDKTETNIYQPHFYHGKTDQFTGEISGTIGTCRKCVEGVYFTVLDILGTSYGNSDYKKLEDLDQNNSNLSLKIMLKNNSNGDTLNWKVKYVRSIGSGPFFLVPYFEKQQKLYQKKSLVAMSEISDLVDINTGEIINVKPNEKWDCYDVTFIETKKFEYLKPYYFLRSGSKEIALYFGYFSDGTFILESEFLRREAEKKKKEEELQREILAEQKKQDEERKQFVNRCIAKFGQKSGALIADGKVTIGMSREMCRTAWGEPIDINKTIVRGLTSEQWVYGWGTYLYFDNSVLTAIQN